MKKWDEDGNGCQSCAWRDADRSCQAKQELNSTHPCNGTTGYGYFYANKKQVEAMLQWYEEKAKTVPEFQVDDKVFSLLHGNGVIKEILSTGIYPIMILFPKNTLRTRTIDGKFNTNNIDRDIYHGHDLEVVVKEKLPIRAKKTRKAWVVLTSTYDHGCISHLEFKTELAAIDYCTKHFGIILSNPIKVEFPE